MKQKFKVWDKKHLQFDDSIYIYLDQDGDVYLIEERNKSMMSYMHREEVSDRYQLIFWTGLTDRNGKGREMYEGDVYKQVGRHYVIEWSEQQCGFVVRSLTSGHVLPGLLQGEIAVYDDYEYVGSIYENPELINS